MMDGWRDEEDDGWMDGGMKKMMDGWRNEEDDGWMEG